MALRSLLSLVVAMLAGAAPRQPATVLHAGSSPQLAMDTRGTVRIIFGRGDTVFAATSPDSGATFTPPTVVAVVANMHLGNTRGPVVASSRTSSLVAATDHDGNTHLFNLDHRTNIWTKRAETLNTAAGSAPEGLGMLAADSADTFYAVWLDYRDAHQTGIYFARIAASARARPLNRRIYVSPDGHVCECCRPSVVAEGGTVAVMFRNWLAGARDLYLMTSTDQGASFGGAQKLGMGTWKLDACPMDGGALVLDGSGAIETVWRRELTIFHAVAGASEERLGAGRNPMMSQRGATTHVVWQDGPRIRLMTLPQRTSELVGEGRLPQVLSLAGGHALVAWENEGKVYVRRM